ncbi:MAG: PDZ domain-containing protein, partial [Bacteroidetes bacterium]|nr:PDZ domain-containing protein [Bacteroidota bacterium]
PFQKKHRPLQDNLSHFKQALRINKKQEKELDNILKRYAKELKKHALLSKGNIMALNADLWNFNKALVADVLSFAEDANAKAFFQVMPANYDPDYYSSIKSFGRRSHPTLADTFIIVTAGKHFTKPFIVEVGKVHQNNDTLKNGTIKLKIFMTQKEINNHDSLVIKFQLDTVLNGNFSFLLDSNLFQMKFPANLSIALNKCLNISIPDLDSSIQKYFDNATKHLKCFTYAYAFDHDSVKKLARKHILKFKFDSDDDFKFDFDDDLDFYFRGFNESFSYFWNDSAFSKKFKIDYPQKAYLGVFIKNLDEELAKELGLKNTEGVYIDGLMEDGAANQAGIREGDVITKVDEQKVKSTAALRYEISKHKPGEKVNITLYRKGKKKEMSAILKSRFDANYLLINKLLISPDSLAKSRYWNWQSAPDTKTNQQMNKLRQENQQLKNDMDALKKQMEELIKSIKDAK